MDAQNYLQNILNPKNETEFKSEDDCVEIELPFDLLQYLSSDNFNIQSLCRICLSSSGTKLFPLFINKGELSEMFTFVTTISVSPDDGLPYQICDLCRSQVINFYHFKNKSSKSDCTLKTLLKGDFGSKLKERSNDKVTSEKKSIEKVHSNIDEIKMETEYLNEDTQYLEQLSDPDSDNETLCIVQNVMNEEINELHEFTDPKSIDQDISKPKKKKAQGSAIVSKTGKKSKSKSHNCTFCSKRFMNLKTLKTHIKRIHSSEMQPNSCTECKASFNSAYDLQLHSTIHEPGPVWRCKECKKEFQEKSRFRRHVQRHMESKRYSCDACGRAFTELYALRRHARVHTGERVEKRHKCHLCDKRYSERSLLSAHVARHSGERPCVCAACGKAFPSARLLASHHLVHTDDKPYPCRYCNKRFRHESTRNTHHRTHTGEKPYVCAACGKTFIQNSNLTLHMRTHTGEKPYTCDTCGRKFSSGSTLKSHKFGHTGEKPFSCQVCGKRFARMDLSAHMRQHTGERPFACDVCARTFTRPSLLRDHCRVHTGEKPFECTMCEQKFTTKSCLLRHIKAHKSKKAEQEVFVVRQVNDDQPYLLADQYVITKENERNAEGNSIITEEIDDKDFTVSEVPLEVTEELVLDDSEIKTDLLVVEETQNTNYQNETLCLSTNGVNFVNNEMNYSDVNLVTVNEGEVSISTASSAMLDGTTVKLFQVDQSLLQIQTLGGQVTISKITSKMTANF